MQFNPELYLADDKSALSLCYKSVFKTLFWLFHPQDKHLEMYQSYCESFAQQIGEFAQRVQFVRYDPPREEGVLQLSEFSAEDAAISAKQDLISRQILPLYVEYFCEQRGHEQVFALLAVDAEAPRMPIRIVNKVFRLAWVLLQHLRQPQAGQLANAVAKFVRFRFTAIDEREIKDLDKDLAIKALHRGVQALYGYLNTYEVLRLKEELHLEIALKYFRSPFLEKKLKGITEIKEISEKVDASMCATDNSQRTINYLTSDIYINWIAKERVLETLLGDSIHIELIKRCHDIIKFLCKYNRFPLDLIETIFDSLQNKHGKPRILGFFSVARSRKIGAKIPSLSRTLSLSLSLSLAF